MKAKFFFVVFLIFSYSLTAQQSAKEAPQHTEQKTITIDTSKLPVITSLQSFIKNEDGTYQKNDMLYQYQKLIENNNKALMAGKEVQQIFFLYKNTEGFTFQGLAARTTINQETLATLNSIAEAQTDIKDKVFILPTVKSGIFIPKNRGTNSLEILLQENYSIKSLTKNTLYYIIDGKEFYLFVDQRLNPTERAYFLDSSLRLPLNNDSFWISSEFGLRKNPFSGEMKNHNGIDMAAEEGTPVYAIKDGDVYSCIENDSTFGNYIVLRHDLGKMTSTYAHLSKITVKQYQSIKKGDIIGYVGQTGMATGPHLHFEIRVGGKALDPREKLDLEQ